MSDLGNKAIMAKNIQYYMDLNNKSRNEMCEALGVKYTTFTDWVKGNSYPRIDKIELMANYFGIEKSDLVEDRSRFFKDIIPVPQQASLPVLGRVCAGNGSLAQEEILYYEPADAKYTTGEYFYLKVKGDSMSPQIAPDDLVLVKSQTSVDSGDLAVVIVDDMDGMIKKVVYDETNIHLISFNPYYPERVFSDADVLRVRVVGKVIESKRKW